MSVSGGQGERWQGGPGPTILATGMRLPVVLGAGAVTAGMLLLGGLAVTELNPVAVVNVDAIEPDGTAILSTPPVQVSPPPHLLVRVTPPLPYRDWHRLLYQPCTA